LVAKVKTVSGIELIAIPSGWFMMGSPAEDKDAGDDEKPRHKVTITQPFYLGKYPVTVGQFRRFVADTGYKEEAWKNPGFAQTDEHPVVHVTWNDADAYCRWLAKGTGLTVRLPREAEWEYSCRAQPNTEKTTRYYFGDDAAVLGEYAWYGDTTGETHPCGRKKPNAFGLYDMHGLVFEWCSDGKRKYQDREETDPVGPGDGPYRVGRGSPHNGGPQHCRAANRPLDYPRANLGINLGFRVLVER
jgi:formylglycine-generating enzyme required for sulfatase activity